MNYLQLKLFITICFLSVFLSANNSFLDTLKLNDKLYEEFSLYYTNRNYINYQWKTKKSWETNKIRETSKLGIKLYKKVNEIPGIKERVKFMGDLANHLFYKDYNQKYLITPLAIWSTIVKYDLQELSNHKKNNYSNYYNELPRTEVLTAVRMYNYFYRMNWLDKNIIEEDIFKKRMSKYLNYYNLGLERGIFFQYNIALFALDSDDFVSATNIWNQIKDKKLPKLLNTLILTAKIEKSSDPVVQYKNLKLFFSHMFEQDLFKKSLTSKYFDYANTLVFGNSAPLFRNISSNMSDLQEAIVYYNKSLDLDSQFYECYFNKAMIYIKLERYPQARLILRSALKQKTTYAILYNIGLLEMKMENWTLALSYLSEALLFKKSALLYNNMAICELNKRKRSEKIDMLYYVNQAINLDNTFYLYNVTKADILNKFDDFKGYKSELNKAIYKLRQIEYNEYLKYEMVFNCHNKIELEEAVNNEIIKLSKLNNIDDIEPFIFNSDKEKFDKQKELDQYENR